MTNRTVKIATRGSKLALYQANKVKEELEKKFPQTLFEIKIIKTKGDKILDVALAKIGDKGLFTKELENSLLENDTDIAVHSLKDIPTELPQGLMLGGVLERAEPRDALVSIKGKMLYELDESDVIATSSLRRKAQLLYYNPKLKIIDIRGNVDTRLQKMQEGLCSAMIMASAGLVRLGYDDKITEIINSDIMIPAVSQGAIALEIRADDTEIKAMADAVNHKLTFTAVSAERAFLNTLEGGCQIPIGAYSLISHSMYKIFGFVSDLEGKTIIKDYAEGDPRKAVEIGKNLGSVFLKSGAKDIIDKIRKMNLG
jgi:hydroxymethylbilane synthase